MSDSLEKLKALSSKLEAKIVEKKGKREPMLSLFDVFEAKVKAGHEEAHTEPLKPFQPEKPSQEEIRDENMERIKLLYERLEIAEKLPVFKMLFDYKAMNLSGIGLKEEDFGEVRSGKYVQVIAISYLPDAAGKKKAKNISLGYFGKGEALEELRKKEIIEFVLRWRYEKAFQNVEHYKALLIKI